MRIKASSVAGLAALLLAAGCTSEGGAWGEYIRVIRQSLSNSVRASSVTRDQAASIPYASIGIRIGDAAEGILVLATDEQGQQIWTSSSHIVLVTRGGRIVRSVGLDHDIAGTTPQSGTVLPPLQDALKGPYRSTRIIDLPDMGLYGVVLNCQTVARGPQSISIIGTTIPTRRIDETCRSEKPRWSFTDNYWIDPQSGFTWHSVQNLHPGGSPIQTEIFRPPG